jgi:tripartite-type tricarboxylate transporter receptor subunit TctC
MQAEADSAGLEDYPSKPVRLIEPFGVGGGVDVLAGAVAEKLSKLWGQPVTVQNHPGGGSTAAPALVAKAPADGYTLLVNTSAHAYSAAFVRDLPYEPLHDFVPVAALTSQAYVLVAGRAARVRTVEELIASAKARPGELTFGSAGVGTGTHLGTETFNLAAGITARHVPPRPADAIADTIARTAGGETDYAMMPIPIAVPHLEDGGLVALGVSSARRSALLPHIPTIAEAGVQGFDFPIWYGVWAPAGTPPARVHNLAEAISSALADPELCEWFGHHGADPIDMTQAEFARFVSSERDRAARIIVEAGIELSLASTAPSPLPAQQDQPQLDQ